MSRIRWAFVLWLPAAGVATVMGFALYATVQQVQRSDANDPQLELAHDAAVALSDGASPSDVVMGERVDMSTSLAPVTIVFDPEGTVLSTDAVQTDAAFLTPPLGVLEAAQRSGENVVTWQPDPNLREAAVVVPWTTAGDPADTASHGTVLVARSLAEVESREAVTLILAGLALIAALIAAAIGAGIGAALVSRRMAVASGSSSDSTARPKVSNRASPHEA